MLLATDVSTSVLAGLTPGVINQRAYTPYGFKQAQTPASPSSGFNGQLLEGLTGWYHLGQGHRVYNPALMRFHTPDTLSPFDAGGLNAYAYCEGDPVNQTDPSGQFSLAIANAFGMFETVAGHTDNIAQALLGSRPRGVLGYASLSSNLGYGAMASGTAMQAAGFSTGAAVSNLGVALVSAGNGVRAAHSAFELVSKSRLANTIASCLTLQRLRGKSFTDAPLESIKVTGGQSPGANLARSGSSINIANVHRMPLSSSHARAIRSGPS